MLRCSLILLGIVVGQAASLAEEPDADGAILTLTPKKVGKPSLKYSLLPRHEELTPGNAATLYYRALLQTEETRLIQKNPKLDNQLSDWTHVPLDKLPREEIQKQLSIHNFAISEAELGARRGECHWELPIAESGVQLYNLLLPEVQKMRTLARMFAVKSRLEIAEGKYDQAVRDFQTVFSMAEDVGEPPFLICDLVGVAFVSIISEQVMTFISSPDAPNLYWPLTALPRPVVDLRPAIEFEGASFYQAFPELWTSKTKTQTPEQWQADLDTFLKRFIKLVDESGGDREELDQLKQNLNRDELLKRAVEAKAGVINLGYDHEAAKGMSDAQAILLYTAMACDYYRDEMTKWFNVSYANCRDQLKQATDQMAQQTEVREMIPVAKLLFPAIHNAMLAQLRQQAKIDRLRVIEAIRHYAAEHDRQLPEKLSDIKSLPLPVNPLTGEPFEYERDGNKATLDGVRFQLATK